MRTACFASESAAIFVSQVYIREFKEMAGREVGTVGKLFHKRLALKPVTSLEPGDFNLFWHWRIVWLASYVQFTLIWGKLPSLDWRLLTPFFSTSVYKALMSCWSTCLYVRGDHMAMWWVDCVWSVITRAETRFRLSAKRVSPFKSTGASVQSTTGSRNVRISGSNTVYTMFWGCVKSTGYPLHSSVSPSLPLPCVIVDSTICYPSAMYTSKSE
jgi:hypothetical protein